MFSWNMKDITWKDLDGSARHHYRSAANKVLGLIIKRLEGREVKKILIQRLARIHNLTARNKDIDYFKEVDEAIQAAIKTLEE